MNNVNSDFLKIFNSLPGLFIVIKTDFTVVATSDNYAMTAMKTRDEMVGRRFFDLFPVDPLEPEYRNTVRSSFERVIATGQEDIMPQQKYRLKVPESEGGGYEDRFWGSVNSPVLGADGKVQYIVRRVEDITKLVTQQEENAAVLNAHAIFFQYSYDLLVVVGADGYFKRVNPAVERAFGYTAAELCSRPLTDFLHPEDVEKTKKRIHILSNGTATIESVNRYLRKDGTYRWYSWNTTPLGSLFYSVGRDITDRVQSDERIRVEMRTHEAQILQLQKMDAVGRLAGGIAHDFNNMLGAISMSCDILSDDAHKPEAVVKKIQDIRDITERAAALTHQLLVFSRKQVMQLKTINLNHLIQQSEKMLVRLIGENIKITSKMATDLKTIYADPSQIEQVILNLVLNARDAMPNGGLINLETTNVYLDESFTSRHLSVEPGHYVLLTVMDTGTGMDAKTIEKIFEPFFTTKPVGKGTGLGLTTTYGIIKQFKGSVWVYSELGQGTVFKIYLPISDKIIEPIEVDLSKAPDKIGAHTILLVEDDKLLRDAFHEMLERKGYRVMVASNADDALEMFTNSSEKVDLLLTDIVMPGMNGIELAKRIAEIGEKPRVLYMSGYTSDALESSGVERLNEAEFLQKPFNTSTLISKVQEALKT